jgi:Tannase-like family of unknown function (DUF6351)
MLARPLRLHKHDAQPSRKLQECFSMQVVVSGSFSTRADGRTIGLVTGLANGTNHLVAKHLRGGGQLKITNDPIGGPILLSSQSFAVGVCHPACVSGRSRASVSSLRNRRSISAPDLAEFHFHRHPSRLGALISQGG